LPAQRTVLDLSITAALSPDHQRGLSLEICAGATKL
jgi:hypothetical protein